MPFNIEKVGRFGCDETADKIIEKWKENGLFSAEKYAFQLALSIAIQHHLEPKKMEKFISKYAPTGVDQITAFCEVIAHSYISEYPNRCDQENIAELVSELATAGILFMDKNNIIIDNQNINYEKLFSNE